MIHTLLYQSEELLKSSYYQLRKVIDPKHDVLHLTITHSHLQDLTDEDLYKKILRLEGGYRTETNKWTSDAVKVRVINQL